MKTALFYINGEMWKRLEVTDSDIKKRCKEYHVATKMPSAVCSMDEAIDMHLSVMKKVIFRLTARLTFALYDEDLYFEDGNVYLKEEEPEEVTA